MDKFNARLETIETAIRTLQLYGIRNTNGGINNDVSKKIKTLWAQYELNRRVDEVIATRQKNQLIALLAEHQLAEVLDEAPRLNNTIVCDDLEFDQIRQSLVEDVDVDSISATLTYIPTEILGNERTNTVSYFLNGYPRSNDRLQINVTIATINEMNHVEAVIQVVATTRYRSTQSSVTKVLHKYYPFQITYTILSHESSLNLNQQFDEISGLTQTRDLGALIMCGLRVDLHSGEYDVQQMLDEGTFKPIQFDHEMIAYHMHDGSINLGIYEIAQLRFKRLDVSRMPEGSEIVYNIACRERYYDYGTSTQIKKAEVLLAFHPISIGYSYKHWLLRMCIEELTHETDQRFETEIEDLRNDTQYTLASVLQLITDNENLMMIVPIYVRLQSTIAFQRQSMHYMSNLPIRLLGTSTITWETDNVLNYGVGNVLRWSTGWAQDQHRGTLQETVNVSGNQVFSEVMFIEIHANDDVLVVLQIRVEHRLTSGAASDNSIFTQIPQLYVNENGMVFLQDQSFLRTIQINRGTPANGEWRGIGLTQAPSVLDMTIQNVFILSKHSIGPVIDATGTFNIKIHYGENSFIVNSSDFTTTELVFGGTRYYGIVSVINSQVECTIISNRLQDLSVGVETLSGGIMVSENFPTLTTQTTRTYTDEMILRSTGIRTEFDMRLIWSSGNNTASVAVTSTVPYAAFQQSPYVKARLGNATVGDTGKRWRELSNQTNMTDQEETEDFLRALLIECNFIEYDMQVLQAPGDIGIRRVVDEQQSIQNVINESLFREIERLEERIQTVEDQVEYLQKQFEMYLESQEGAWWEMFIDVFIDLALGVMLPGIGGVIGGMYSSLRKADGLSRRLTNAKILGITNKEVQKKMIHGSRINPGDLTVADGWVNGVLDTLKKKRSDFTPTSRPAYRSGNTRFQHLDDSEKIDIWSNFKFGKRHEYLEADDLTKSTSRLREFNPDLFPNFTVHARPLNIGPGKASKKIFDITNSADRARSEYYSNLHKVNTRRPMHSFVVYETLDYQDSGRYLTTKRYIGVNEMSRNVIKEGDFGSSVGGLRIKYETWKIRGSDGKLLSSPLSHTESGYSAADVDRLFASAFGKEVNGFELGTAAKWEMLVSKVDNQILKSPEIYSTLVTNSSMGAALDTLLNQPPVWKYNLLFNNCQDFARDITRIVRGENFRTSRWDSNLISEISRVKTVNLTDVLTSSTDARMQIITPMYKLFKNHDELYRRTKSRRRVYALMHDNRGWTA